MKQIDDVTSYDVTDDVTSNDVIVQGLMTYEAPTQHL